MGENSSKKEIIISVRIDGQKTEVINASVNHYDLSRSELNRNASSEYVSLPVENPQFPNPKLLFSHIMLKILLKAVNTETIKELADPSFLNGKRDYCFFKELTTGQDPTLSPDFSKEDYLTLMIENVFSKIGQNS